MRHRAPRPSPLRFVAPVVRRRGVVAVAVVTLSGGLTGVGVAFQDDYVGPTELAGSPDSSQEPTHTMSAVPAKVRKKDRTGESIDALLPERAASPRDTPRNERRTTRRAPGDGSDPTTSPSTPPPSSPSPSPEPEPEPEPSPEPSPSPRPSDPPLPTPGPLPGSLEPLPLPPSLLPGPPATDVGDPLPVP